MKTAYKNQIREFLEQKTFVVFGYSSKANQPANAIYKRLKNEGYKVFAVNPKAHLIQDLQCYPSLKEINENVDVAVLCTPKQATESAIVECSENGVRRVWIHEGIIPGSYDLKAHRKARELGIDIIPGGCPIMYLKPDILHKCFRWFTNMPRLT